MIAGEKKSVIEDGPLWFLLFVSSLEKKLQPKSCQMLLFPDAVLLFFPKLHYLKIIFRIFFPYFLCNLPTFLFM